MERFNSNCITESEPCDDPVYMPRDWDDHTGWDRYYRACSLQKGEPFLSITDIFALFHIEETIKRLKERGWKKCWFPGCGISSFPRLYAAYGFHVWGTDISQAAVEYQQSLPAPTEGELHFFVHDFRCDPPETEFDFIENQRAFQGLSRLSMGKAARCYFQSLKPGGHAYFDTINVRGRPKTTIEEVLSEAGFHIPCYRSDCWYRDTLDSTGIEYAFGWNAPYAVEGSGLFGGLRRRFQQKKLDRYHVEYCMRQQREADETEALWSDGKTRVAHVLYNTG